MISSTLFKLRPVMRSAAVRCKSTTRSGDVAVRRGGGEGGGGLQRRGQRQGFDDLLSLAPFFDATPLAPLRPDRVFDLAQRMMDSVLPPSLSPLVPRLPQMRDIERSVSRGLEHTVGLSNIALDIAEKSNEYVITAEVPGVSKDTLSVEVDEDSGLLTIMAEKTVAAPETRGEQGARDQAAAGKEAAGKAGASSQLSSSSGGGGGEGTTWLRAERAFGRIERSLSLPADADYEKISAKLEHGVLSLIIPKKPGDAEEQHGRRKVEIA